MHRWRPAFAWTWIMLQAGLGANAADTSGAPGPAPQTDNPEAPPFRAPAEREPFQLPPLPPAPAPEGGARNAIVLKAIRFEGNSVISTRELDEVAAEYLGRAISEADIEALRRKVTERYVATGYISSGATTQAVSDGVLVLRIVEGKARVQARGLERLRESYVTNRLVHAPDETLNIDALRERFQLLLEDPLFARINARVMPGLEPGEAIVDLDVERAHAYQLTVFANNYRPPSVGANAYGLAGVVRNLTGFGDALEANLQEPADHGSTRHTFAAWHVPLNRWGTTVSASYDQGRSVVQEGPLNVLDITSTVDSADVGLSHPLLDTLRHRFLVGADYVKQKEKSTLLGIPFSFTANVPEGLTEAHTWRVWQAYTYRTEVNAAVVRLTYSDERNNNEISETIVGPPRSYHYWLAQFQYAHKLGEWGQGVVRGTAQHAASRMLPLDALAVGGVNTVRGFRENQLVRDGGEILGAQVDLPLPVRRPWPAVTISPFFDWGRGSNVGERSDVLSSVGLALRAVWKGLRFDLAVAKRLIRPDFVDASKGNTLQDKGIHLQLAYDVF